MTSLRASAFLGSFLLFVIIVQAVPDQRKPRLLVTLAIAWIGTSAIYTVYMFATYGGLRIVDVGVDVNHMWGNRFANSLSLCIPVLWYAHRQRLIGGKTTALAIFAIGVIIALAQSRGGFISMAVVITLCAAYDVLSKRRLKLSDFALFYFVGSTAAALVIVLLVFTTYGQGLLERLSHTDFASYWTSEDPTPTKAVSDYGRKAHMAVGIELVKNPTVLGIGYMAFGYHVEKITGMYITSHNLLFTVLGELGFVGLILALSFLLTLVSRLRRGYATSRYLMPEFRALYPYLTIALFVAFLQWQWRPQHDNIIMFATIGIVLNRHSWKSLSVRL